MSNKSWLQRDDIRYEPRLHTAIKPELLKIPIL